MWKFSTTENINKTNLSFSMIRAEQTTEEEYIILDNSLKYLVKYR